MSWRLFSSPCPLSDPATSCPVRTGGGPTSPLPVRVVAVEEVTQKETDADGPSNAPDVLLALLPDGYVEVWGQNLGRSRRHSHGSSKNEGDGISSGNSGDGRRMLHCLRGQKVVDMCRFLRSNHLIIVVTASGEAFKIDWVCDTIVHPLATLQEQPGSPVRTREDGLRLTAMFRHCVSGDDHLVLVDRQGQAWSWMRGWGPQRGLVPHHRHEQDEERQDDGSSGSLDSPIELTRIDYFQGLKVISVTVGSHFNLALVEHVKADQAALATSTSMIVGASRTLEQQTVQGDGGAKIGSCPLGLPIASKVNTRRSQSVLGAEPAAALEDRLRKEGDNDHTLPKPEINLDTKSEDVKLLSQSGLYINATDAIKYLSNQLPWTGNRLSDTHPIGNCDDGANEPPEKNITVEEEESTSNASSAVMSHLYKATSNVMVGGVKYMGQTVSRLSQSFSVSSETDLQLNEHSEVEDSQKEKEIADRSFERPPHPLMAAYTANTQHRRSQSASMLDKLAASPCQMSRSGTQMARSESPASESRKAPASLATAIIPRYEVWFWGHGSRGQAGQGDMLDRFQPCQLTDLADKMVRKVACGRRHCLALTMTGAVYGWGDNSLGQACPAYSLAVCPMPTKWNLPPGETAADIAAVGTSSFVLTDCGKILRFGTSKREQKVNEQFVQGQVDGDFLARALFGGERHLIVFDGPCDLPLCKFKALEKHFLQILQEIMRRVVEPLCCMPREESKQMDDMIKIRLNLMRKCNDLLSLVQNSVAMLSETWLLKDCDRIPIVRSPARFNHAFCEYNSALCDCLISGCLELDSQEFARLTPTAVDILEHVCRVDPRHLEGDLIPTVLSQPMAQLEHYLSCFRTMTGLGRKQKSMHVLRMCDLVETAEHVVKGTEKTIERQRKTMEETKTFWEMHGPKFLSLKDYRRRVLLNSKQVCIHVSGGSVVNRHWNDWIVLMNDLLVHSGGYSAFTSHPLKTIWLEGHKNGRGSTAEVPDGTGGQKHEIVLTMPEETLTLVAPTAEAKSTWYTMLQQSILDSLRAEKQTNDAKLMSFSTPPISRTTKYRYQKLIELKGAEYVGTWLQGKMHGHGIITWPDGRVYRGQIRHNEKHGYGILEAPPTKAVVAAGHAKDVMEGEWRSNRFEGQGRISYANGDTYEGQVRDGRPHGQGTYRQLGRTKGAAGSKTWGGDGAAVYVGEWNHGLRQGYGVADNIASGEKYLGMWAADVKSGPGCVVGLDGVYYEGTFSHGKMTGKGLMLFDDGTSYEGNFADTGVFSGQGVLSYACSGSDQCGSDTDRLEGTFFGNYTDGIKFNGTIFKCQSGSAAATVEPESATARSSRKIGTFAVEAAQKWTSIFSRHRQLLFVSEEFDKDNEPESASLSNKAQLAWEHMAILINQAKNCDIAKRQHVCKTNESTNKQSSLVGQQDLEGLEMIPDYHSLVLTNEYFQECTAYLWKAFNSPLHPLNELVSTLSNCFNASYGGLRTHPRLLKHAVQELKSVSSRIYEIINVLFPALPPCGSQVSLESTSHESDLMTTVDSSSVVFPHLLPRVHSSVFPLYALHYRRDDDEYWARILKWNRHPDLALLTFLDVAQKFWIKEDAVGCGPSDGARAVRRSITQVKDAHFSNAVETLQHIKTKFTPLEKLHVVLDTFREVNSIGQSTCGLDYCWSMDDLFPVFQYVVVRARILQLGAEIHMIEDLVEPHRLNGEYGIMFTTLQASYYQILKESASI